MSKPETDLDNTLASDTKEPSSTHTGNPQASSSDAMLAAMLEGMRAMSKDENLRKKIGMLLV